MDSTKPNAFIVDIDGTLALRDDNVRSPYDWHLVDQDTVNNPVLHILWALHNSEHKILLVSGRDEVCEHSTRQWLANYQVPYHALHMRPHKNQRPDTEIKLEIYKQHIEPHFNVLGVFDDRNKVVAMWREQGLTCLQVAEGDF